MSCARKRAHRDGVMAETHAAWLYRFQGYRIVPRRYHSPVGEIDLVATKGERLAFVEVKRRKTQDKAAVAATTKQNRRIVRAAQYLLASHLGFVGHSMPSGVVLCVHWALPRRAEIASPV